MLVVCCSNKGDRVALHCLLLTIVSVCVTGLVELVGFVLLFISFCLCLGCVGMAGVDCGKRTLDFSSR